MTGFSARMMAVVMLLLAAAMQAQAQTQTKAQRFPAFDPERIFMLGDADLDGRLSLDEYRDFLRSSPRMRDAAAIEPMFRRLDADRDGFLSLAEYRKSFPQRPGGAPAKTGAPKEKPPGTATGGRHHARAGAILRGEDPARPRHPLRQVPREHRREAAGRAPSRQPRGTPPRRRLRPGDRPRPARREPAPPRDPLPRRRPPDAPQGEAAGRGRRGLRGLDPDGRPDPRTGPASASAGRPPADLAKGREFWSFRPPKKSSPPSVKRTGWPRGDIDRFLLAALEARGLAPVADAGRPRLLRRVTFDLSGLPPTPEELDAFLADDSPDAFAKVVDRLLASPRFGERWGRHWLDVARYAESSGKTNFSYPQAWRYRGLGDRLIQRRQAL